ncbi:AAA family ATPase [Tamlana haliotis]|uniref:AAA family ATPase n=1 Tax=Pseudotamlana haliotis TaxID=2614804 RepID=A0A6N6MCU7_9FLAO|nr:AAA family ATPase [Tamlana haliotis]KAB1068041.1 AAA family ATPase [Tamlana haliotis]
MTDNLIKVSEVIRDFNSQSDQSKEKLINEAKIDVREELKPPEAILLQINSDNEDENRILCTAENIMLVSGKAKSRKSFLLGFLVAPLVSGRIINGVKGCLPAHKNKGIFVDTEQGKYHVQLALKRICKMSGVEFPNNLDVLAFRKYAPQERLALLEYAVYNTKNLGFIVIDGIKDLITSINNEEEATMIMSKLMKWSEELNIAIIIVLHQNKSDTNARGHIGTEAINKAETHISVTKSESDNDVSIVEPQGCRNREPEPFAFEVLDNLPVLVADYKIRTETKTTKIDFSDIEDHKIYSMLNTVFSNELQYTYTALVIQIKLAFKTLFKKPIGDNKAKELISYCKNNKWLLQAGNKQPYTQGNFENNNLDDINF